MVDCIYATKTDAFRQLRWELRVQQCAGADRQLEPLLYVLCSGLSFTGCWRRTFGSNPRHNVILKDSSLLIVRFQSTARTVSGASSNQK